MNENPNINNNENQLVPVGQNLPDTPPPKKKLSERLSSLTKKIPLPQETSQRKSGANLLRFMALLVIFTLIARGTAGATLAVVQTGEAKSGEVTEVVNTNARVAASASDELKLPSGLTVQKSVAQVGQSVEKGDPLLTFDPDELQETIAREQAALAELEAKLKKLTSDSQHDGSALANNQNSLSWAQNDYNAAQSSFDQKIASLQSALDAAAARRVQATERYENLPADSTEEEKAAAEAEYHASRIAETEAYNALNAEKTQASSELQRLSRELETQRNNLNGTKIQDQERRQQESLDSAANAADAKTVRLDIEDKNKSLANLRLLAENDATLRADTKGIVLDLLAEGSKTSDTPAAKIADDSSSFTAEALLTKEEARNLKSGSDVEVFTNQGFMGYSPSVTGKLLSLSQPDESGMIHAKISLPKGDWKHGDSLQMKIIKSRNNYSQCVPATAIRRDNQNFFIYTVEERKSILGTEKVTVPIPVKILAMDAGTAAIEPLAPLEYGAPIIISSDRPVEAGARVRVQNP